MHATQADAWMYQRDRTYLYGMHCMHCPVTSQADACTYCMGSKVSSLPRVYLYSSYFATEIGSFLFVVAPPKVSKANTVVTVT
jgi:hypothetical protein